MEESSMEPFYQALRELRWRDVNKELERRNYPSMLVDEYITAWEQSNEYCIYKTDEHLPHCNTTQLHRVLATATEKGWWKLAGEMLKLRSYEVTKCRGSLAVA
jgi:hypothetical protein